MADFALELSFDGAGESAVVDNWLDLHFQGLPSQSDHRSMTNAPHLSLVVAREIPREVRDAAVELLAPLLPTTLDVRGLAVFGTGARVTLAWLAEPEAALVDAVGRLRALTPDVRHPVWTPHVTLGRRIPRERVGEAIANITDTPQSLRATRLRWWDPDAGVVETLADRQSVHAA